MKRLNGNVTIITGGGKGIGYGLAEAFAEEGSNLVITGRTEARLIKAKHDWKTDMELKSYRLLQTELTKRQ